MSEQMPKKWSDLRDDEREALLEFAQLPPLVRKRIYRAGSNIGWWDGLAERAGRWKLWIVGLGLLAGWATGFLDALASAWMGRK